MAKLPSEMADAALAASVKIAVIDPVASSVRQLAEQFGDLKKVHEMCSSLLKDVGEMWDACEKQLIEEMISEGISSVKIDGYGNFILSRSAYPSVNAGNKPQFYEYLKASGHGDLLRLDVPAPTLTAFLKGHREELKKQFTTEGVSAEQAALLANYTVPTEHGIEAPYSDAAKSVGVPVDEMVADELASALLKSQGATMFTKSGISLRK